MITNLQSKYIKSLQNKKGRHEERAFLVEGRKNVLELLESNYETILVVGTAAFFAGHDLPWHKWPCAEAPEQKIAALGTLVTNEHALAVARMQPNTSLEVEAGDVVLALDDVRDPGNLGTILRIADWYGISKIAASATCAEFYNPKVISASMGSFTRVKAFYTDLSYFIAAQKTGHTYGAFPEGRDVHGVVFEKPCIIVLGNESRGINHQLAGMLQHRISIPRYGRAESLNVAVAAAVVCDNLRRG